MVFFLFNAKLVKNIFFIGNWILSVINSVKSNLMDNNGTKHFTFMTSLIINGSVRMSLSRPWFPDHNRGDVLNGFKKGSNNSGLLNTLT